MPSIVKIINENNEFQHIEVLKRNREKRHRNKEFFVEGVKAIERAIRGNWDIVSFVYTKEKVLSQWAMDILDNSKAKIHYELTENLMDKLSDREETSELIAIIKTPDDNLSRIKIKESLLIVVFDRPSNPGNLGTIIRSCDSFSVDGLIITGHSVDLYDPQTIRASVGSIFSLPVIRLESHKELVNWIEKVKERLNIQIIGSSAKATKDISKHDFTKSTIYLLGNETDGLSKNYKELCDELIKIPIHGTATSLNVACAVSISLYEIDRQRRNL